MSSAITAKNSGCYNQTTDEKPVITFASVENEALNGSIYDDGCGLDCSAV